MFSLTETPIDHVALRAALQRPDAGALVVFEGWVRNHHQNQPVTQLDYEAFTEMATREGEAMVAEVEAEFPGVHLCVVHRTGALVPGDIAVWIGAACAHRDAAFRAARLAIEEIKRRLPVWKKEYHPGAEPVWVNCTDEAAPARFREDYHARQLALPEVGRDGQARLAAASVLIVGVGGLGCPAALYLAGAGVGRLTLVDGGLVELSNLHRQPLYETGDVGAAKASRAALALRARAPHVTIEAVAADLTGTNARALLTGRSIVLDCSDNFTTRLLLHDLCHELGVPLVQAAVHRWEGTLNVFQRGRGGCLYCTGLPHEAEALADTESCDGAPVFAPAVGVLGVWQAAEALKLLLQTNEADASARRTLLVDLLSASTLSIARPAQPDCLFCGEKPHNSATAPENNDTPLWIKPDELAKLGPHRVVVLLTAAEQTQSTPPPGATVIHPGDFTRVQALAADSAPVVLSCPHGIRSVAMARTLRAGGYDRVRVLRTKMTEAHV